MKIELKSIKHSKFASEETECYTASLYVDGKKIGTVKNAGHGGCDEFIGDQAKYRETDDWCKANLPKWTLGDGPADNETTLELYCGELLENWMFEQEYRTTIRKKVLFKYPDDAGKAGVYQIGCKGKVTPAHIAAVKRKEPDAIILNEMPLAEAVAIFRAAAA